MAFICSFSVGAQGACVSWGITFLSEGQEFMLRWLTTCSRGHRNGGSKVQAKQEGGQGFPLRPKEGNNEHNPNK